MQNRPNTMTSASYFEARGLTVAKGLRDWLSKATFIAKDRPTAADRQRYEWWVVNQVEAAAAAPGGVDGKDWRAVSVVMPAGTQSQQPGTYHLGTAANHGNSGGGGGGASPAAPDNAKALLYQECQMKSPADVYPFAMKALELLDVEVRSGRRSFQGVTFQNVTTVAMKLKAMHEAKVRQGVPPAQQTNIVVPSPHPQSYHPPTPPLHSGMQAASPSPYGVANKSPYVYQQQTQAAGMYASSASPYIRPPPAGNAFMYGTPATASAYHKPLSFVPAVAETTMGSKRPRSPPPQGTDSDDSWDTSSEEGGTQSLKAEREQRFKVDKKAMKKLRKKTRLEAPAQNQPQTTQDPAAFFVSLATATVGSDGKAWLVGKSTAMERNYSRDEPCAEDIRPLHVLVKAFDFVMRKATHSENPAGSKYLSDQLKGMRQDLVVQNIRTNFTVSVYEAHARAALDIANVSEFTQCQAGLRGLYKAGLQAEDGDHLEEFMCYRIIYFTLSDQIDALASELQEHEALLNPASKLAKSLSPETRTRFQNVCGGERVLLTMRLSAYLQDCDSLKVMKTAHVLGEGILKLIKMYLQRERVRWLQLSVPSFKGGIPSLFVLESLGFMPSTSKSLSGQDQKKAAKKEEIAHLKQAIASTTDAKLQFIDSTLPLVDAAFSELMKDIKMAVPAQFDLTHDVRASLQKRLDFLEGSSDASRWKPSASIDSGAMSQAVQVYCNFLSNVKTA